LSPIDDNRITVELTPTFHRWLGGLRDRRAVYRITQRIVALRRGHWGDVKPVGDGVSEMRIFYGPGYRLYATQRDAVWIIMLAGGDKDSQRRDIEEAKRLAKELRDGD
jgi:putative addiction module killer protein